MRKYHLILPLCTLLLTGCADIRNRISPDALAISADTLAMHVSGEEGVITAHGDPLNFPDAMCAAAGAEISPGHIAVLTLSEHPAEILPRYLQNGWLAPTAQVLYAADAVSLLQTAPPSADDLKAAADTGCIPPRTADAVLSDLLGGSGVTALTAYTKDGFRLAVFSDAEFLGTLSDSACRGLALLCGRYRTFTVSDSACCVSVEHAAPDMHAALSGDRLQITVSGTFRCKLRRGAIADAQNLINMLLTDALTETVTQYGADLLNLQERADACAYSSEQWRGILRNAVISADAVCTVSP